MSRTVDSAGARGRDPTQVRGHRWNTFPESDFATVVWTVLTFMERRAGSFFCGRRETKRTAAHQRHVRRDSKESDKTVIIHCLTYRLRTIYWVDQKLGDYVRPSRLTAHNLKMPEPICMIFGTLRRRSVVNAASTH